jgi:hypothetical protein
LFQLPGRGLPMGKWGSDESKWGEIRRKCDPLRPISWGIYRDLRVVCYILKYCVMPGSSLILSQSDEGRFAANS